MHVYFTVNVGRKFRDSSWCPFNRGCLLSMGSTQYRFHCNPNREQLQNLAF